MKMFTFCGLLILNILMNMYIGADITDNISYIWMLIEMKWF